MFFFGFGCKCRKKYEEYELCIEEDIWKAKFLHIKGLLFWDNGSNLALNYLLKALEIAEKIDYKRGIIENYYVAGIVMVTQNNKKGYEYKEKALELAKEIDYKVGVVRSLRSMGVDLINKSRYEEAFEYFTKALELAEVIDNDDELTY